MYPTPAEINHHHQAVLDTMHRASSAWLNAAKGLTEAGTRFARASLASAEAASGPGGDPYQRAQIHLDGLRGEAGAAIGHGVKVAQRLIADLVEALATQRQHTDALIVAGLERGARMLPDQLAHVMQGAENTLLTAEHTAEDVAKAGLRTMRRAAATVEDAVLPAAAAPTKRRPPPGRARAKAAGTKRSRG